MRSYRLEEPFAETATEPRAHPPQVERDDADKGASIAEIKREWNLALEQGWIGLVVDEDGSLPCGEQKRFTDVAEQAAPARSAQIAGEDRCRHRTKKLFGNPHHAERFVAELRQSENCRGRQSLQAFVSGAGQLEKFQQIRELASRVSVSRFRLARFRDAIAEDVDRRIDFALLSLARDSPKHGEDILRGDEVIASIAEEVDNASDPPVLQLAQARARVRPGNAERFGDFIGRERPLRK